MKIKANRKDLLQALTRCASVADSKSTMPTLGSVLIEIVDDDMVRLSTTDLYLSVVHDVPATVEGGDSLALPAKGLLERIKHLPEGEVTIEADADNVTRATVRGSKRRYVMHGFPGEDFPEIPAPQRGDVLRPMGVETLARLIESAEFSVSADETRLHLNSAKLEWCDGGIVRMVSTDGHRLSKIDVEGDVQQVGSMLLPLKALREIRRMLGEAGTGDGFTHVDVIEQGAFAFFDCGTYTFGCKTVDAEFPPWQQVVPESTTQTVRVAREALLDSLRAVKVSASALTGGVRLDVGDGLLKVSAESAETGEAHDEIETAQKGTPAFVGCAAQYLVEPLAAMRTEDVELGISGELDPIVLRPHEPDDGGDYTCVVMPMRI